MSTYRPDTWAIISIKTPDGEMLYKVAAGWAGSYLEGASWKISSGIVSVEDAERTFNITNHSGSVYSCFKGRYGLHWYAASVVDGYIAENSSKYEMKLLSEEEAIALIKGWK